MPDPTDVIISWFGSVPAEVRSKFSQPTRFIDMPVPDGQHYADQAHGLGWPHPLRGILQKFGVSNPKRVCVFGFSQGCQGVLQILKSQDAGYIEHAMMFDGLHCSWYPGSTPNDARNNIEGTCLGTATAFAALAAKGPLAIGGNPPGQHYFTLTHSSIIPPTYPATFDTAREIIARLWEDPPDAELPPGTVGMTFSPPWMARGISYSRDTNRYAIGQNGLVILGYDNLDPAGTADHIYQGNVVLKTVLEKLLVPRWNAVDPSAPSCGTGTGSGTTGGPQCNPTAPVTIPEDFFQNPQDASTDWLDWVKEVKEPSSINVGGVVASAMIGGAIGLGIKEAYDFFKKRVVRT